MKVNDGLHILKNSFPCQGGAVEIFVENTTDYLDNALVI